MNLPAGPKQKNCNQTELRHTMDKFVEFYIGAVKMLNNLDIFWTLMFIKQNIMKQGTIKMFTNYINKLANIHK
jgi:hypothetical protein